MLYNYNIEVEMTQKGGTRERCILASELYREEVADNSRPLLVIHGFNEECIEDTAVFALDSREFVE